MTFPDRGRGRNRSRPFTRFDSDSDPDEAGSILTNAWSSELNWLSEQLLRTAFETASRNAKLQIANRSIFRAHSSVG